MPAPAYDETNIFAKILRGELPCHKVYEDDVALAFMDIMPRADGHVLVLLGLPVFLLPPRSSGRASSAPGGGASRVDS